MSKLAGVLLVSALALSASFFIYSKGANSVQVKWDAEKESTGLEMSRLRGITEQKQLQHQLEIDAITDRMETDRYEYEQTLAAIRSTYDQRLLTVQKRADVYERFSQGTASERDRLAKHATELDRSLEEGRALVRELGATLGQRDAAIRSLGSMILTDRNLIN